MCKNCGAELTGRQRMWCSLSCKNVYYVRNNRRNMKLRLIERAGGKCTRCGYDKYAGALQFHHRDPTMKDFGIGAGGHTMSWERACAEADKCDLVCANCHAELHSQVAD